MERSPDAMQTLDQWVSRTYTAGCEGVRRWLQTVDVDPGARSRLAFAAEQYLAAIDPQNFLATNRTAIARAVNTSGASLAAGMRLMAADVARGRVANSDESAFEVGVNLAISPGAVVMKNALVELIQYQPATPKVGARPLLIVPPCINKYYILDLQPENSFVRHCVAAGHTVFMLSWRNPGTDQASLGWDDYLERGVVASIRAAQQICRTRTINALGFCVGGTLLTAALAALAARGEKPVASLTLLATLLDFSAVGQLEVFIDAPSVAWREATLGSGGLMSGRELAGAFASLRPRDLVWNYVNRGYLQGEAPPAFDLLFWNADSTNLPGPMACWYLRHLYLENRLREPGALQSLGVPLDLGTIDMPAYLLATREDHIVPWRAAFETTRLIAGDTRFVLGASGHIAGVINPAGRNRRSYWRQGGAAGPPPHTPDRWQALAVEVRGSWWNDWATWIDAFKGRKIAAPKNAGSGEYAPMGPAPGEYVKVRI